MDGIKNFRELLCCINNFSEIWIFFFGNIKCVYRRYIVEYMVLLKIGSMVIDVYYIIVNDWYIFLFNNLYFFIGK